MNISKINYLFWAVFTIVRTSWTMSSSLSWSLLLAASTKQHERWSSRSWRLVDLTSQMTAKFCWMTEIQYLSFSIISITLSNVLLAFFNDISTFCWFFFIRIRLAIRIGLCTYGVGIVDFWRNAREFLLQKKRHRKLRRLVLKVPMFRLLVGFHLTLPNDL